MRVGPGVRWHGDVRRMRLGVRATHFLACDYRRFGLQRRAERRGAGCRPGTGTAPLFWLLFLSLPLRRAEQRLCGQTRRCVFRADAPMTRLAVGGALALLVVACRDVPQAPTLPTPPAPGPFAVLRVDRVGPPIMEPASFSDAAGSLHLLYGAWAVGAVRYAGCATNCDLSRSWHIGEVDSSFLGIGDGGQVAAGLTTTGIHLLYQSAVANGQNAFLSYGWCPGACYLKTSWLTAAGHTKAARSAAAQKRGGAARLAPASRH